MNVAHHGNAGLRQLWRQFWLCRSSARGLGRVAAWLACRDLMPYHQRAYLADLRVEGFVAPSARIAHPGLAVGRNVFIGDRVMITCGRGGGRIQLHDRVHLYGNSFLETGLGGWLEIGESSHIQPGCHFHSYLNGMQIGNNVEIAPNCGFYNYNHGTEPGSAIMDQSFQSKGGIVIEDGAWLGHGVTVLPNVRIGRGAVIGAGAVVARDVPDDAIATGVPARVTGYRNHSPLDSIGKISDQAGCQPA